MSITVETRHGERWYTNTETGLRYPSITTITEHAIKETKPLTDWKRKNDLEFALSLYGIEPSNEELNELLAKCDNNADEISNYYTSIGTALHEYAEGNTPTNQRTDSANISLSHAIRSYQSWEDAWNIVEKEVEVPLLGEFENGWAGGTSDVRCLHNEKIMLAELKTSRFVQAWHAAQAAAYAEMFRQNGRPIDEIFVVQVSKWKSGEYHTYRVDEEKALRNFNSLHQLFLNHNDGVFA